MSTINIKKARLILDWNKEDPANVTWQIDSYGYVDDDTEPGGASEKRVISEPAKMLRTQFRAMSCTQLETQVRNKATQLLQELGTGAGSHVINNDTGD